MSIVLSSPYLQTAPIGCCPCQEADAPFPFSFLWEELTPIGFATRITILVAKLPDNPSIIQIGDNECSRHKTKIGWGMASDTRELKNRSVI